MTSTSNGQMAATVGVALLGTVFANGLGAQLAQAAESTGLPPAGIAFKEAFSTAIRQVYWVWLAIVALGMVRTWHIPELPLRKTH